MKSTLAILALGATALITSCASNPAATDPEYQQYLAEKKAKEAAAVANNPFGAPAADANTTNEFGVPQNSGVTGNAGFQQLPGLSDGTGTINNPAEVIGGQQMNIPSNGAAQNIPMTSHTVVSGDSLWALSRKYGVSLYALRVANNLEGDKIITGQVLQIPAK